MDRKPRNRYKKLQNEIKKKYFDRITSMLLKNGYNEEDAYDKCCEKWHEQLTSYLKQEDRFIYNAF